jgi:hypothetical protein
MRSEHAQFKEEDIENIDKIADFLQQLVILFKKNFELFFINKLYFT